MWWWWEDVVGEFFGGGFDGLGRLLLMRRQRLLCCIRLELRDLLPAAGKCVGEDQDQIALCGHSERGVNRFLFVDDDRDTIGADAVRQQRCFKHLRHFVVTATALAVIAATDVLIKLRFGSHFANGGDVLITAIARC